MGGSNMARIYIPSSQQYLGVSTITCRKKKLLSTNGYIKSNIRQMVALKDAKQGL